MEAKLPPLVAVVGPTAVGKTEISLELARRYNGEIISADSRQIYRGLDIGTAKVGLAERAEVAHHLIDVVDPDEVYTLAQYQRAAYAAIAEIHARDRLPFLVGGTGLYIRAVLEGWGIPEVPPDMALREELESLARSQGRQVLHDRLRELDPVAAERIDPRNVRRVVRAIEVCLVTGEAMSVLQQAKAPPLHIAIVGLTRPRHVLFDRIDRRVDSMIAQGLVQEVQTLLQAGYSPTLPALTGLGYRQIIRHLLGELTLEEAIAEIKRQTRRFVRQQGTWFRLDDPRICWFDLEQSPFEAVSQAVSANLS